MPILSSLPHAFSQRLFHSSQEHPREHRFIPDRRCRCAAAAGGAAGGELRRALAFARQVAVYARTFDGCGTDIATGGKVIFMPPCLLCVENLQG